MKFPLKIGQFLVQFEGGFFHLLACDKRYIPLLRIKNDIYNLLANAAMAELGDALDLGSSSVRSTCSSHASRTRLMKIPLKFCPQ